MLFKLDVLMLETILEALLRLFAKFVLELGVLRGYQLRNFTVPLHGLNHFDLILLESDEILSQHKALITLKESKKQKKIQTLLFVITSL